MGGAVIPAAPFDTTTPLVPGYHFFQMVATRPDGTTYRTAPLRVPVWGGDAWSAGGVTIPDADPTGITNNAPINDVPAGLKVIDTIYRVAIKHTWDADLTLQIIAPDGTTVTVADHLGGSGDDYGYTTFWDGASQPITAGTPPFPDLYRPQNPFSAFNGKSLNGTWRFRVIDSAAGDVGTWDWMPFWVLPD